MELQRIADDKKRKPSKITMVFFLFTILLFFKNTYFQVVLFHLEPVAGLWQHPLHYVLTFLPYLMPAIFVASFVFVSRRLNWTWIVSFIVDLWACANIIYYRAFPGFLLTIHDILMTNNMHGFWDSILSLLSFNLCLFPVSTLLYMVALHWIRPASNTRKWKSLIIIMVGLVAISPYRMILDSIDKPEKEKDRLL